MQMKSEQVMGRAGFELLAQLCAVRCGAVAMVNQPAHRTRRWCAVVLAWMLGGCISLPLGAAVINVDSPVLSQAMARAMAMPRPRSLGASSEQQALRNALLNGERREAFNRLRERVQRNSSRSLISSLPGAQEATDRTLKSGQTGGEFARRVSDELVIKNAVEIEAQCIQEAAFVAWANENWDLSSDVRRRVLALAALDPAGVSGARGEELTARNVALTLALALDWHYSRWTADERERIARAISSRMDGLLEQVTKGNRALTATMPVSHSTEIAGALAEIAVLMLGETNSAEVWMKTILPVYASTLSRWGGSDGGFANGTAYASWDVGLYTLRHLDTLRIAAGIDLFSKDWVRNFGRYLVYMLPPGTPRNVFGDAAERGMPEEWARFARAYALRVPDPLYLWYAKQWFQQDDSRLELLAAPPGVLTGGVWPADAPHSAYFPSIGWVGMHSDVKDRGRVSVYFKSSPYGSISHSHADQNSFTLVSGGQPLLIDSGYYDAFGSNHHFAWTRRTIAHNAITVDGGQGQGAGDRQLGDISASGRVTQYDDTGSLVRTTGDATTAYKGLLSKAVRSVAYIRPKTVVIFDAIESPLLRTIEWNLHSQEKMRVLDGTHLEIANGGEKVCLDLHADTPFSFAQKAGFPVAPARDINNPRPDQWHGVFSTTAPVRKVRFVGVLRVGCERTDVDLVWSTSGVAARVAGTRLNFNGAWLE